MTVTAIDVAAYILRKLGRVEAMKLQKLVYYSQCYSLVRDGTPLFADDFQAWKHGPVLPGLWRSYSPGTHFYYANPDRLSSNQSLTIDLIIDAYGGWSSRELSQNTHNEDPWKKAREGCAPDERSNNVIRQAHMRQYHQSRKPGTRAITSPLKLEGEMLSNVLAKGRLKKDDPSGILDVVARHVANSQQLEGIDVTSDSIRKHLNGRSST